MEQFKAEHRDPSNEHLRAQEAIKIEYDAMQRYFALAGIPSHQVAEWINENGASLRKLVENNQDFLEEFAHKPDPNKDEFENRLAQYH